MDKLRLYRPDLVARLDSVSSVIDLLFSRNVLTNSNKNKISSHRNPDDQIRELLDIIGRKGPKTLGPFCQALIETDNEGLAKLIDPSCSSTCQTKKHKGLIFQNTEREEEIKANNIEFEICTQLTGKQMIEKLKEFGQANNTTTAADNSYHIKNLFVLILGYRMEDIQVSELCTTLKNILPGRNKFCLFLLHPDDSTTDSIMVKEPTDIKCFFIALSQDRLNIFLDQLEKHPPVDDSFSSLCKLIKNNEKIWPPPPGYILYLQGNDEISSIKEFIQTQPSYLSESCTQIDVKLKYVKDKFLRTASYFLIFLMGKYKENNIEDIFTGEDINISVIFQSLKKISPEIKKICILLQSKENEPKPLNFDRENDDSIIFVSLTAEQLGSLIIKLNNSNGYLIPCIEKFISQNGTIL